MFEITLIAMGKLKEKFYLSAAAEYEKRLKGYCQFKILELPETRLPDNPSPAEISTGLEKEADLILSRIPKGAWFCTLTPEGKMLSSETLADKLKDVKNSGKSSARRSQSRPKLHRLTKNLFFFLPSRHIPSISSTRDMPGEAGSTAR